MKIKYLLLATALGGVATPAMAQQTPAPGGTVPAQDAAPGQDAAPVEGAELVVTGSRLRRDSYDAPTPTVTIGQEDLESSGDNELSETLADMPALSSTTNEATVTGNVQNSGLSAIQLRNLGDNRTLVLIDGRRTVSNSGIGNRVSLSTIPSDFVDRIEIITGGASSIYGSDAVAGVVNIITESRQRGVKLNARAGISEDGDAQERTFNGSYGTRFADGRGYFLVSGTYDQDVGVRATDREWATRPVAYAYDFTTGLNMFDTVYSNGGVPTSGMQPGSTFPPNVTSDLSSYIPGGVFSGSSSSRDRFYRGGVLVPLGPDVQTGLPVTVGTTDNGNSGYFLPNRDGYNQRTGRDLVLPRTRYLFAGKLDYKFNDSLSFFAQAQYSKVESTETREAVGIGWDSTYDVVDPVTGATVERTFGRIACRRATGTGSGACNPYVPAEIRADAPTTGTGIAWDRRFDEVGGQQTYNDRQTIRSWAGLRGDLSSNWSFETSVGYGQFKQHQLRTNDIIGQNLTYALNAEIGPDGAVRCADAAARAAGCVPINIFGEGAITPAAANYIRADLTQDLTIRQVTGQAYVTGNAFNLPAGPVGIVAGAEYRRDSQHLEGNGYAQFGGTTGNLVPNFGGAIDVVEGFGEVSVPLLRGKPFFHALGLDGSARVARYSIDRVGTVFSWRGGAQWSPVRDIKFRGQFARAQRAPDIAELYSPPRGNFEVASDVCNGVTPTTTGTIAASCRANPGIQALFASQALAGQPQIFTQSGTQLYSPNGGNLNLKAETANTFTAGVVVNPTFLGAMTLSVDYYNIRIKDAIDAYSNSDIQLQCYDTTTAAAANPFCADIVRNPLTGQITQIVQRQVNLSSINTSGIDVAFSYRFGLESLGIPGRFDVRYDGTHILKQETRFQGINGLVVNDYAGDLSQGSFKYRARGSLSWAIGPVRLRWTTTYYGKVNDSNTLRDRYLALLATLPTAEEPTYLRIGAVAQHDIYFSIDAGERRSGMRFYGGVKNLTDKVSPFLPSGTESGRLTNQTSAYDIIGRRFYVGATLNF
jgi:iron complex outermembrane recepter protein